MSYFKTYLDKVRGNALDPSLNLVIFRSHFDKIYNLRMQVQEYSNIVRPILEKYLKRKQKPSEPAPELNAILKLKSEVQRDKSGEKEQEKVVQSLRKEKDPEKPQDKTIDTDKDKSIPVLSDKKDTIMQEGMAIGLEEHTKKKDKPQEIESKEKTEEETEHKKETEVQTAIKIEIQTDSKPTKGVPQSAAAYSPYFDYKNAFKPAKKSEKEKLGKRSQAILELLFSKSDAWADHQISFSQLKNTVIALGGKQIGKNGSRVRFELNGIYGDALGDEEETMSASLPLHTTHGRDSRNDKVSKLTLLQFKSLFERAGVRALLDLGNSSRSAVRI